MFLSLIFQGFFLTKIFHPNVSASGEICVNTLKKDWKSDLGIKHVLLTIKCLLIIPNPESALNEEAGKLLLEQYGDYCSRAKLYTEIHARSEKCPLPSGASSSSGSGAVGAGSSRSAAELNSGEEVPKKIQAVDKKALGKKEKSMKEKKKTLKRL